MLKKIGWFLTNYFIFLIPFFCTTFATQANSKEILNVLSTMGAVSASVISQFEKDHKVNVRIDFVGGEEEYAPKLQSHFRNYDIIIAKEGVLQKLFLKRQLRPLSEPIALSSANAFYPLEVYSKLNSVGTMYVTLEADPLGVAYLKNSSFLKDKKLTLSFIDAQLEKTAPPEYPLEFAFLSKKINAAVVFRSRFIKYEKVVPELGFAVPENGTYYDRVGVGISDTTMRAPLAEDFIKYLYKHKESVIVGKNYLSCKTLEYNGSKTVRWILYNK